MRYLSAATALWLKSCNEDNTTASSAEATAVMQFRRLASNPFCMSCETKVVGLVKQEYKWGKVKERGWKKIQLSGQKKVEWVSKDTTHIFLTPLSLWKAYVYHMSPIWYFASTETRQLCNNSRLFAS